MEESVEDESSVSNATNNWSIFSIMVHQEDENNVAAITINAQTDLLTDNGSQSGYKRDLVNASDN